jgi:outer membrane protein OmpA-like peptidoglycan-associated protein
MEVTNFVFMNKPRWLLFLTEFMRRRLFLFIYFSICFSAADAQVPNRAQRFYNIAMTYEAQKEHARARKKMEAAIRLYPAYTEAYSMLGAWYFHDHQFNESARIFQQAYHRAPNGERLFALSLAKSLVYSGRAGEALDVLAGMGQGRGSEWEKLRAQASFVAEAINRPWRDTVFNMGRPNTRYAETFPWIAADEQKIYFTRRMRNVDEDFFTSEVDSCGGWFTADNMGSPPNTPNQEAAQMISADGHYLFFMQCENRSINGWGQGGCDLYMSYRSDSVWSAPQSFGATINTPGFEGMPCLSPDNKELYFVSDRQGGYGGYDLWVSRFENSLWQAPVNLGPQINTPGNETAPFLHTDNSSLYFSSTGQTGMGGADLFMSRRINDSSWSKPMNMGYPINTSADESSLSINLSGTRLYFASDRDSVAGNFDLYEMKLPEPLKPVPVNVVKGFVYDSISKNRLSYASIYVKDAATGDTRYHFNSNRGDGSFMITLPAGRQYTWHTDRVAFQDGDLLLDLTEQSLDTPYLHNIALLPSDYVAPVNDSLVIRIHFPRNSAKLTDPDKQLVRSAIAPWLEHKDRVVIFINGYTDNTGTPMLNEELSHLRAGLVAKEVSALGIDEMNLHVRGWGEAEPLVPNDTEENMNLNRRVEVVIRR